MIQRYYYPLGNGICWFKPPQWQIKPAQWQIKPAHPESPQAESELSVSHPANPENQGSDNFALSAEGPVPVALPFMGIQYIPKGGGLKYVETNLRETCPNHDSQNGLPIGYR